MNRMNAIELVSEAVTAAPRESGDKLNCVGVYQEPLNKNWGAPMSRLGTPAPAIQSKQEQSPKRIFIVEDHPAFREELQQILKKARGLVVCGTAGEADQVLPAIAHTTPDLVLADIGLPGKRGLKLIKEIRSVYRTIKLLVISMHLDAHHAARALRLGGDGYITRQEAPDDIVYAIHDVLKGHIYVTEKVIEKPRHGRRSRNFRRDNRPQDHSTNCLLEIQEQLSMQAGRS